MAGIFIDPAESFSRALNQGLSTFKSYRDEARQDEDRAFTKQMAMAAEDRARRSMVITEQGAARDEKRFGQEQTLWPSQTKAAEQGVELGGLQIEGAKTQNEIGRVNLEYLPQEKRMGLQKDAAAINSANASADSSRASAQATRDANRRAQTEFNGKQAALDLVTILRTGNFKDAGKLVGTPFDPLKVAATMHGAPTLSAFLQNPTALGSADAKTRSAALQFINGGFDFVGPKFAQQFGFRPGSSAIVDLYPAKGGGRIGAKVVGIDAGTGKSRTSNVTFDADKLFDRANLYSRTFSMIARDPKAKAAIAEAVRYAHPDVYEGLAGKTSALETANLQSMTAALTEERKKRNPDMARIQMLQDNIHAVETGGGGRAAEALFSNMGEVGGLVQQPPMLRAYNAISEKYPNLSTEQVSSEISGVVGNAMRSTKDYEAFFNKAGLTPRRDAKGRLIMSESDVLQAIGRF